MCIPNIVLLSTILAVGHVAACYIHRPEGYDGVALKRTMCILQLCSSNNDSPEQQVHPARSELK